VCVCVCVCVCVYYARLDDVAFQVADVLFARGRVALQAVTDAQGVDANGVGVNGAQPHALG